MHGPAAAPFTLTLPANWRSLSIAKLTSQGPAIAGYERSDGRALVVIRRAAPLPSITQKFVKSLDAQFKKKLADYQPVAARIITTKAGAVFFFSYIRRKKGTLDTVVLVPAGDHSFVLDSISNPNSTPAARDVGAIINSFLPG